MIVKHALFATREEAEAAAAEGVARIEAQLTAAAQAVLPTAEQALVGASPLVSGRILAATSLPIGAFDSSYFPKGVPEFSEVTMEITTSDGQTERVVSRIPSSIVTPQPTKTKGKGDSSPSVLATTYATLTVRASVAKTVQIRATTALASPFPINTVMSDPNTGKRYKCTANTAYTAGVTTIPVVEVSTSEEGDVTNGTVLLIEGCPAEVLPIALVYQMDQTLTIPFASQLTDPATGRMFICGGGTFPTVSKLSGNTEVVINFVRVPSLETEEVGLDTSSTEVGTTLEFVTPIHGVVLQATTKTKAEKTIPKDSPMVVTSGLALGKTFTVSEDVIVPDSLTALVPFVADVASRTSDLAVGDTIAFSPAIAGVTTTLTVVESSGAVPYPLTTTPEVVGAALTFSANVRQEIYGGQWSATLQPEMDDNG